MKRWKKALAAFALAGMTWFPAAPAQAQTVITGPGMVTTHDGVLRFSGTVAAVDPDSVALQVGGQIMHVPMALARFSIGGAEVDTARLRPGLPVTVSMGTIHGTVTGRVGNAIVIETASGRLEVPAAALNSSMMQATTLLPSPGVYVNPVTSFSGPTQTVTVTRTTRTDSPLLLQGRVSQIGTSTLVVDANGNLVTIPSSLNAGITVNGAPVTYHDLAVGNAVSVAIPAGSIRSIDNGVVTYDLGTGTLWRVPLAALPVDYSSSTLVWMRDANGRMVQVPLGQAVDFQRQGAVIVPADRAIATPPDDRFDDRVNNDMNNVHNGLDTNGNFDNPTEPANINH